MVLLSTCMCLQFDAVFAANAAGLTQGQTICAGTSATSVEKTLCSSALTAHTALSCSTIFVHILVTTTSLLLSCHFLLKTEISL